MSGQKTIPFGRQASNGLIGAGILTAIAASLCCITPVLALIAGSSGLASTFSWLEPARPYLISITVLVIGFAWYQKFLPAGRHGRPKKSEAECECEKDTPSFLQSKKFLGIVTAFAALMLAFPSYSKIFFAKNDKQIIAVDKSNIQTAEFIISGMTCSGCEEEVKHEVNKLNGIIKAEASYEKANAQIQFDNTKTNVSEIEKAINSTGYQVTKSESKKEKSEIVTFYDVPLVCPAATKIGCGSRAKPVLLEMEKNPSIKEAWLNREGTVYAIVWTDAAQTNETAMPVFEKYKIDFKTINGKEAEKLSSTFRETGKWYRGAEVDKLSIEEAGVIAKDAVTFALNEKLLNEQEANNIKVEMENYLKTELIKIRTVDELYGKEATKKFKKNLSEIIAKIIGEKRAAQITELYMQKKSFEKEACCKKK